MPLIPQKNSVPEATQHIRRIITRVGRDASHACKQIRQVVKQHGRSNILAELGDDAVDVRDFYNDIVALALKYSGEKIAPIPADPVEGAAPEG